MSDFTPTSVTYTAKTVESKFQLEFFIDTSMPTVEELDVAVGAFFDSLAEQRPGLVSYVRKELGGRQSIKGNFWGGPTE
jgi:hypothetical protein